VTVRADAAVRVRDLRKAFGEAAVLDGVDLDATSGEITVLLGPNGAGKTLLLSCIAGGLHPDGGEVSVFGRSPSAARTDLTFGLQDGMLVPQLTGRENVAFFRDLHPGATDRWRDVLTKLDFDADALDREVRDYSGGMTRKLELAIACSVDAPLVLLDEPTAALDMTAVEAVHSLLADRAADGDAVVLSSHLPVDADLADSVAVVTEHGVVAQDDPETLLADVPPVVRARGLVDGLAEHVREGRVFRGDDGRRGFLPDGADRDAVVDALAGDGGDVHVTDPTVSDLFDYHVHVA
jgi:ABC-type multidrug transport system ATPase subunit